jgi:hypothetical protein
MTAKQRYFVYPRSLRLGCSRRSQPSIQLSRSSVLVVHPTLARG